MIVDNRLKRRIRYLYSIKYLSSGDIAKLTNLHVNTVKYHLRDIIRQDRSHRIRLGYMTGHQAALRRKVHNIVTRLYNEEFTARQIAEILNRSRGSIFNILRSNKTRRKLSYLRKSKPTNSYFKYFTPEENEFIKRYQQTTHMFELFRQEPPCMMK